MKRLLALTLLSAIAVNLFACSSTEETNSDGSQASENITYEVYLRQSIVEYPPDGGSAKTEILNKLETDLGISNVDYNVVMATGADYDTKLNTMMVGGNVPDLFVVDIDDLETLAKNGVIAPIDDLVANMPTFLERLENPIAMGSYDNFMYEGEHYGFIKTALPGPLNNVGTKALTIRTDWLENVGMESPKTLDELYDVLYAFTYNDPDGNGEDDTYGLGGNKNDMFASIFAAYGVYMNGVNSWTDIDGELVHSTVLPETKEALELLSKWYAEGIIDPDKFIVEGAQADDKFIGSKFGVYEQSVWGNSDARSALEANGSGGYAEFFAYPEGPDGLSGYPISAIETQARVVSADCVENSDPETLAAILDWMINDETDGGLRLVQYGVEGVDYEYDADADTITQHSNVTELYEKGYSNPVRWIDQVDRRWIPEGDARITDFDISNNEDSWIIAEFSGSVPAMKDYPDLYTILWAEYFTKIITGVLPIEAFDEYVEKFYSQGGTELTEQVNAAWKN